MTNRKSSIELLKIIAIFMIVLSHVSQTVGTGVFLNLSVASTNIRDFVLTVFMYMGSVGSAMFFVCSAWFMLDDDNVKANKIWHMIIDCWIVSVLFLLFYLLRGEELSSAQIFRSLLPTLNNNNWYIPSYLIIYAFHPVLNKWINSINKKTHQITITIFLCLYLVVFCIARTLLNSSLIFDFVLIYFIVAYCKKYLNINRRKSIIASIVSFVLLVVLLVITNIIATNNQSFSMFTWMNTHNVVSIVFAISVFYVFNSVDFENKYINSISSLTLLIYITHENIIFRSLSFVRIMDIVIGKLGYDLLVIWELGVAFGLLCLFGVISFCYLKLMSKLVNKISSFVGRKIQGTIDSINNRIVDSIDKQTIKNSFNKNKKLLLIFTIIWVVVVSITLNRYSITYGKESDGNSRGYDTIELYEGTEVIEKVEVYDSTECVSIKFGTYARKNKGNVFVKIVGEDSGIVYADDNVVASNIQDNAFVTISLNERVSATKDRRIIITLTSDSKPGQGIGVYYWDDIYFEDSDFIVNKEKSYGDMTLRFLFPNDELKSFCYRLIAFSIIGYSLLILLIILEPKYEVLFACIVMVFGLVFMVAITPQSPPDEGTHYESSYQTSNILMFKQYDEMDTKMMNYSHFGGHFNTSVAYQRIIERWNDPLELKGEYEKPVYDIKNGYTLYYVPQAIGIVIARLLNLNMLKLWYLGRFTNLLFYTICIYIAVKKAPIHKMLIGIIASTPMFIQQAASFSYDTFINGLSFIILSFLLKWMFTEERISKKEYFFVFVVEYLLAPAKIVYGLFILLYWFIPTNRFYSKKHKVISILLLCGPTIYMVADNLYWRLFVPIYNKISESLTVCAETSLDSKYYDYAGRPKYWTIRYCISHLDEAFMIFYNTIRSNIKRWYYDTIGHVLSGQSLVLPLTIAHLTTVMLAVASLREEEYVESVKFKITSVLISIISAFFSLGIMLIGWTLLMDTTIQGIQGRYFCPLLAYVLIIFNNKKISIPKKYDKYVVYALIVLTFEVFAYVVSFTFVN